LSFTKQSQPLYGHNKRLHADAQTYALFVGFAALHFTTKISPVWALVSRAFFHMKPIVQWTEDWEIGVDISRENEISLSTLELFIDFWDEEAIAEKSKSTLNRYRAALQSLGGYIVEQSVSEEGTESTAKELLLECIDGEGGPLLFQGEETWQNELDMVCRKIYRYYAQRKC
jgi:hypothetical protein